MCCTTCRPLSGRRSHNDLLSRSTAGGVVIRHAALADIIDNK
jgi:hypothetical protein